MTVDGDTKTPCNAETAAVTVRFIPSLEKSFVRGNANNDAKVDIADPIWIINELFRDGPESICQDAADANDDGDVDSSDAVFLIEYLFNGGITPPLPFPDCGPDPDGDEDGLSCAEDLDEC